MSVDIEGAEQHDAVFVFVCHSAKPLQCSMMLLLCVVLELV